MTMLAAVELYCEGYALTRLIEACQQRALFSALDANTFRGREELINAIGAHASHGMIVLEALASAGVLERSATGGYRLGDPVDGELFYLDLSSLYEIDPQSLTENAENA